MKYKKTFYGICLLTFTLTLAILGLLILCIAKVISFTSLQIVILVGAFLAMSIASFACACILQMFYDDWRRIKRNGKWKH